MHILNQSFFGSVTSSGVQFAHLVQKIQGERGPHLAVSA